MARRSQGTPAAVIIGFLVFAGFCGKIMSGGSDDSYSTPASVYTATPSTYMPSTYSTPSTAASSIDTTSFYAHDAVNVRSRPGKENGRVRTLARGDYMRLGSKDANGWAPLYNSSGVREGYVYRASAAVRTSPPAPRSATAPSRTTSRASSAAAAGYYTGPRGGCYTYSSSGRKRYVDHSYCN